MAAPAAAVASHYLYPCLVFAHREAHQVATVLGSCVSVCLRDPVLGVGGINHYMLALWNGEGLPTPKYGNIAIEKLVRALLDLGCARHRLEAKVFGGANVIGAGSGAFSVGERNIAIAHDLLAREGIAVAAEDTGGSYGRKLIYHTGTGTALVARIQRVDGKPLDLPDGRPKSGPS